MFKRLIAFLFVMMLSSAGALAGDSAAPAEKKPAALREWTFIYVMSYDNNLDSCTKTITEGLAAGIGNDTVAVNILSDTPDAKGLWRVELTAAGQRRTRLASDDITDPAVLREFLDWSQANTPARRYAIVFLDHGGRLDDMCLDEHKSRDGRAGQYWMSAKATGEVLRQWRSRLTNSSLELLFLQQYGRGSLENLYNFHDTANYILASQYVVGACNTYYTQTVQAVCESPDQDGAKLASLVMRDEHYTSYTLLRGAKLRELPRRADALAAALMKLDSKKLRVSAAVTPCFQVPGENNYDVCRVLDAVAGNADAAATVEINSFENWLTKELIVRVKYRRKTPAARRLCGVSLNIPMNAASRKRYADLPLHRESNWSKLTAALAD